MYHKNPPATIKRTKTLNLNRVGPNKQTVFQGEINKHITLNDSPGLTRTWKSSRGEWIKSGDLSFLLPHFPVEQLFCEAGVIIRNIKCESYKLTVL